MLPACVPPGSHLVPAGSDHGTICINAGLQPEMMCFGYNSHSQQPSSEPYQKCRICRLGGVMYVALIRNLSFARGIFHICAHCPFWFWLTALTLQPPSCIFITSDVTRSFDSFFVALDHILSAVQHPKTRPVWLQESNSLPKLTLAVAGSGALTTMKE